MRFWMSWYSEKETFEFSLREAFDNTPKLRFWHISADLVVVNGSLLTRGKSGLYVTVTPMALGDPGQKPVGLVGLAVLADHREREVRGITDVNDCQ